MTKIKVLSKSNIKKIINLKMAIKAVEKAYKQKSDNKGEVWPLVFYEYEHNVFDLDIRSGNLKDSNAYGLKMISYNENNSKISIPVINATALIFNDRTGEPLALLNAEPITSYRTGAAAAIGAKLLARKNSKTLLIVGSGNVAKYSTAATLLLFPKIENVYIYNSKRILEKKELSQFKKEVESLLKESNSSLTAKMNSVKDIKEITAMSDIIITATPSEKALIKEEWVKTGTHFSCMGAGTPGKQEIDERLFTKARFFADDQKQCFNQGEAQYAYKNGLISSFDGEIGDLLTNKIEGRTSDSDITIFDSTGLFLQDLAMSLELIDESNKKNIGMEIDL